MRKLFLTAGIFWSIISANAQSSFGDSLDINNVKVQVTASGLLHSFENPKGSGKITIAASNLWCGGFDPSNVLKVAGQTYRQTGTDFWPGPLDATGTTNASTIAAYDKVWKLGKCDIDTYINWLNAGSIGPNPTDPAAMNTILNWPAMDPWGMPLAPFVDVNANYVYDPYAGDYPDIEGDQAIFFVFNDNGGIHTETGGAAIGAEVRAMVYAYGCSGDSALYNSVFARFTIINKSSIRVDSTFFGLWSDFDIGNFGDDYVGCDATQSSYFGYNATSTDPIYGANPPAQGVVLLRGPYADDNGVDDLPSTVISGTNYADGTVDNERLGMSRFGYYNNDFSVMGNPTSANEFYNYMTGMWKDATPWTYGGNGHLTGVQADYLFPGSSDPLGFGTNMVPQPTWDEVGAATTPNDRRGIGSFGPFTFEPATVREIEFAYVFGKATSGGNLASLALMHDRIDSVKQQFSNGISTCSCNVSTGINETEANPSFVFYPNPASESISISFETTSKNVSVKIYDAQGKLVKEVKNILSGETSVSISDLNYGIYLIHLQEDTKTTAKRFIKQ